MKVAIVGPNKPDCMEANFQEAFLHRGDDCRIFESFEETKCVQKFFKWSKQFEIQRRKFFDEYDKNVFLRIFKRISDYNPDLVICFPREVHPILISKLKDNIKCKVIQVNPDQMTTLGYQQIFASDYDVYFTKDPYMVRFMRDKMGLNAKLYTEAFNVRLHKLPNKSKEAIEEEVNIDVMTYGTMYPYRCRMIKHVVNAGIDIKLYGVIPNRFYDHSLDNHFTGKYITGEEKAKILYGSKIVFNQMHYAEVDGVDERFVEANGCGAFQISDYKPILKELLPVDPELVSFKTIDEGIDKIKYYLAHPQDRYAIASKVQKVYAEKYSYDSLIDYILNNI